MKRLQTYIQLLVLSALLVACGNKPARTSASASASASAPGAHKITKPVPPAILTDDSSRIAYMSVHYWDTFDFTDTTWIADTAAMEQVFADWARLLGNIPTSQAAKLSGEPLRRAEGNTTMLLRLTEIAEHYFAHPNSPYRSEELFIPVLEAVLASGSVDSLYKIRPQAMLKSAMKNRPGSIAADITYTNGDGSAGTLSSIRADHTLLMFYNPDCHDCARVEAVIAESQVIAPLVAAGRLKVLAIYPDEDPSAWRKHLPQMPQEWIVGYAPTDRKADSPYDLPAIPCLYLLDKEKRVILKDAPVERIEAWLDNNLSRKSPE